HYTRSGDIIIDTFAGTGTTPIVLATQGIQCGYSEINPAMLTVIQTKIEVASLSLGAKNKLAQRLRKLSNAIQEDTESAKEDATLFETYKSCFGDSTFFDADNFKQVLRLRSLCDSFAQTDQLIGKVLLIAVLSQLIPCSLLKRQGDVRFKTKKELVSGVPRMVTAVAKHLLSMAADCDKCPPIIVMPTLLTPDAKALRSAPKFHADGVITSPPYLNGTNYIRNTKIELWFCRHIQRSSDLRLIRDKVVTSGINDVVKKKGEKRVTKSVNDLVTSLEVDAYDDRIPRMVAAYFEDMHTVFLGLQAQTENHAIVCVDIGDSRFGGVSVPTHTLLVDVAATAGFQLKERLELRKRTSRDQGALTQDLLVFEKTKSPNEMNIVSAGSWADKWANFKNTMPHQRPPFTARNWGHPRHSVCSFQGKMKPSLAHFLVDCFSNPNGKVLDPFSGSGTIPFEAALMGRQAYAFDISLMSCAITSAKISPPDMSSLNLLLREFDDYVSKHHPSKAEIDAACSVSFNKTIPEYFHAKTMSEIIAARSFLSERRNDSVEWNFIMACMLHILHGNRPYALSRRSHSITPYAPTGPTEYRSVSERLRAKVSLVLDKPLPPDFLKGKTFQADILKVWPHEIQDLDAIITSPPFFDSQRFYMTNWMRYWFCGWSAETFQNEPSKYVETQQKKSMSIYSSVFTHSYERLKPGGLVVFHLGKSRKCDMAAALVREANERFNVLDVFEEPVLHCEKHGVRDKGTVTDHQYLILQRRS
ncbi:MAG: DNA methyltransferase, partial [bacterium]